MDVVLIACPAPTPGPGPTGPDEQQKEQKEVYYHTNFYVRFNGPELSNAILGISSSNGSSKGGDECFDGVGPEELQNDLLVPSTTEPSEINNKIWEEYAAVYDKLSSNPNSSCLVEITCNDKTVQGVMAFLGHNRYLHFLDINNNYVSTNPSPKHISEFRLKPKRNVIKCRHKSSGLEVEFCIWKYHPYDKLAVVDIDGTITKSDIPGYVKTVFMKEYKYLHTGVVAFLRTLEEDHDINPIYLTSRPFTHRTETRALLTGA